MAKGTISVNSENIFPVIKKWLYSDKDIFIRELVSNACDAVTKMKKLVSMGDAVVEGEPYYKIDIVCDKEAGILSFSDNGIGMTAEEIDKYITQIAFSGAADFLEKYKDSSDDSAQIIGHFGLGFYSAFMAADCVEIDTLSYKEGAAPAKWVCEGGMEYEMTEGTRTSRGTTITLHIADDSKDFLEPMKVHSILAKYCSFLPVEIYLTDANAEKPENGEETEEAKLINDTSPLWTKKPSECEEEDYKKFYTKVFGDFNEPLFWIHLNVDYPFNLKGILYFPKLHHEYATREGQIKLYNNQVFVADNVKEVIPEFLMLLKGVIDCPDLPLNVSRSFLQNDGYVNKISAHITKKVSDKLTEIYKKDKESYNKYWDDINVFIKYGCMRDEKFFERVKDIIVYKDINSNHLTADEYLDGKEKKEIFYVSDEKQQAQYVKLFKEQGQNAVILPTMMDTHFISFLEMKDPELKFSRIDSGLSESLKEEASETDTASDADVSEIFKSVLNDESLKIEVQSLKNADVPAVMLLSEQSRRMQEMYKSYGQEMAFMSDMFKDEYTLVLNRNNFLIKAVSKLSEDDKKLVCEHIYDLAAMSNKPLDSERMTKFIERSNKLLEKIY